MSSSVVYSVSIICLLYMIGIVSYFIYRIANLDREGKLYYLKNFKKGKFALIYIPVLLLYFMGHFYAGKTVGWSILLAIKAAVELVILKFDYSSISALAVVNKFYSATVGITYVLIIINAIVFVLTFAFERLYNYYLLKKTLKEQNIVLIVGYNDQNINILKSIDHNQHSPILLGQLTDAQKDELFVLKIPYIQIKSENEVVTNIEAKFNDLTNRKLDVIVNFKDDVKDLIVVGALLDLIKTMKLEEFSVDYTRGLDVFSFGDKSNMSTYSRFVNESNGCIHYINKYKIIATDFLESYPLTQFMTDREIDYNTATIKNDISINVVMIGFGKTNQEMFLTSVANNQFLTLVDGKLVEKVVHYEIFDKVDSKNDKNLNHNYYRYCNFYDAKKKEYEDKGLEFDKTCGGTYLELPEKPANVSFNKISVDDTIFYDKVEDVLKNSNSYNSIIIAFGSDLENLDLAEKMLSKIKEWGVNNFTKIYVKIRNTKFDYSVIEKVYKESELITFGNENTSIYNIKRIINDESSIMAKYKHLTYAYEYKETTESIEDFLKSANSQWYKEFYPVQRDSNTYAVASIRQKLQMLGYDYVEKTNKAEDLSCEFMAKYTAGNPIEYTDVEYRGKKFINYPLSMQIPSLRTTYAIQEHYRWNAYMICNGYIPSSVEDIKQKNKGKRYDIRQHGNVTTIEGLVDFRNIVAQSLNKKVESTDVIKYDYQLLDDVVWLLSYGGYKIVKKS